MATTKEICGKLMAVKTGFTAPSESHPGELRDLTLADIGSFLTYKNRPDMATIEARMAADQTELKPRAVSDALKLDYNFPSEAFAAEPVFNRNCLFLALNISRREKNIFEGKEWYNFHEIAPKGSALTHVFNLAMMTNHDVFRGCYVTDILKNTIETEASKVVKAFNKPRDAEHEEAYRKSADLFVQECAIVQPKQLVVMGGDVASVVTQMKNDGLFNQAPDVVKLVENLTKVDHYASRSNATDYYINLFDEKGNLNQQES